ncbi:hypothetical protein M426DRAFT_215184 [Hypoxylon sp. CI-4A]|nr:hypothetical protein M426DRAFT_215184 [Hypoxylon sp. CI-4A]
MSNSTLSHDYRHIETQCSPGYVFYSCGNGFDGCCSEPACDLDTCPANALDPKQSAPSTESPSPSTTAVSPSNSMATITLSPPATTSTNPVAAPSHEESHRLPTAAIVGISIGATVLTLLLLLIAGLLIRRRRIAKRNAAIPPSAPFACEDSSSFAEKFMMDHPSWKRQSSPQVDGVPKDTYELP